MYIYIYIYIYIYRSRQIQTNFMTSEIGRLNNSTKAQVFISVTERRV